MELDKYFNYVDYEVNDDKFEITVDDKKNLIVSTDILGVQDIYLRVELK